MAFYGWSTRNVIAKGIALSMLKNNPRIRDYWMRFDGGIISAKEKRACVSEKSSLHPFYSLSLSLSLSLSPSLSFTKNGTGVRQYAYTER